ncbi:hypothetical protein C0993_004189, partial [Termitomyces sp. T159_Od127]
SPSLQVSASCSSPPTPSPLTAENNETITLGPKSLNRQFFGSFSQGRILDRTCQLLIYSDLKTLMAINTGTIKLVDDACEWLEIRGWILTMEPYNKIKMVNILVTAAISSKPEDLKQAIITVTFLLDANITDHISDSLTQAVATKAIDCIGDLIKKLEILIDFLVTNNAKHTKSSVELREAVKKLEGVTSLLDTLASKLVSPPFAPFTDSLLTWASIAKAVMTPKIVPSGV